MRTQATGTVLNALLGIGKITSALFSQGIKRAIAKQAAKLFCILALVAGKILAFGILKEFIIFHIKPFLSMQIS